MFIEQEEKLDYCDVLLVPNRSSITSRSEVDITVTFFDHQVTPIISANMDGVGTFEMAKELAKEKIMTALTKHYSVEQLVDFYTENQNISQYVIYSMGTSVPDHEKFMNFLTELNDADIPYPACVCVDVANGYTRQFEEYLTEFAETFPEFVLIAGNVVTPEQTDRLIECGVDVVKVGLGSGSVCTTRKMTGVGYPQFSAIVECSAAARDAGGSIIADGGITCPGDAAKAFGAGADLVMLGGYFAGHHEGGMLTTRAVGEPYVMFYGMASKTAQELHNGGVADYRASEGKVVYMNPKGKVENTVKEFLGGLRSACAYVGAESIDQLHRKAKFIRVNHQMNNIFGSG
jgi:GMP reductase